MLLPLGGSTVIDRILEALDREPRIEDVYISTNERFTADFRAHLGERSLEKPRLSVESTRAEEEKLGVVGALQELIEREQIDEDLLVVAGDNLFDFDIGDFLDAFDRRETPTIATYDVGTRERAQPFGVVAVDGDRVVDFAEKPDEPAGSLVSIGCYAFPSETLPTVSRYLTAGHERDEIGWFIKWMQDEEPTHAFAHTGSWFDIGTRASYLDAVQWTLGGSAHVSPSASVSETTIGSNVQVYDEADLVGVTLESAVIFPSVRLRDTTVRNSVIDEHASLGGIVLEDGMVGAYTSIPAVTDS